MEGGDQGLRHPNPSQKGLTSQGLSMGKEIKEKVSKSLVIEKKLPKLPQAIHGPAPRWGAQIQTL
ncbi:hypothetical protein AOY38_15855 [Synechocystis sp. PCC 6803]|nr:hypothetical protein AOY38_15855 [Synechocystis sp. PCC 6803]